MPSVYHRLVIAMAISLFVFLTTFATYSGMNSVHASKGDASFMQKWRQRLFFKKHRKPNSSSSLSFMSNAGVSNAEEESLAKTVDDIHSFAKNYLGSHSADSYVQQTPLGTLTHFNKPNNIPP